MQERIADLQARRDSAFHAGSERAVERQHAKGKLLARERIDYLLDDGSFHELDMLARHRAHEAGLEDRPYTDGVITGWGTVEGRRVFDLRWLAPLPIDEVFTHADEGGRVLVVDETRHTGGVGEGVVAGLVEGGYAGPLSRVAARDTFIPLGEAANLVLVSEDEIIDAARRLCERPPTGR